MLALAFTNPGSVAPPPANPAAGDMAKKSKNAAAAAAEPPAKKSKNVVAAAAAAAADWHKVFVLSAAVQGVWVVVWLLAASSRKQLWG